MRRDTSFVIIHNDGYFCRPREIMDRLECPAIKNNDFLQIAEAWKLISACNFIWGKNMGMQ